MPEKPTPQFFKEAKKRCPQCGGALPCSTHSGELKQETEEEVEMNFIHSETLYEAPQNETIHIISVAPDGTNWSVVIERADDMYANCINRVVEGWHNRVSLVQFAPNGHHVYITSDVHSNIETSNIYKDGKKIDINGKKIDIKRDELWPTYILDDGRTIARTKQGNNDDTKYYLYVGDGIIAQSDYGIQRPSVSGTHYACVLINKLPNGETVHELIYDGKPKIQADVIDRVVLKDNGKTLAYAVRNRFETAENTAQQEATIYVNDEIYEQVTLGQGDRIQKLWASKAGKRVAYMVMSHDASDNETTSMYIDHEKAPYNFKVIVFSPNEENMLGIAVDEERDILLLNGKEIIKAEWMWSCGFLDNKTWCVSCQEGSDHWLIINNIEGEHFTSVHTPQQSPDKKHIAYIAEKREGRATSYYVVINHETKPLPFNRVDKIRFSNDGKSLYVFGTEDNAAVKKTFSLNTPKDNQERALPTHKQY